MHGFRSSFRTWAAERTSYTRDVCEMALAHKVGDLGRALTLACGAVARLPAPKRPRVHVVHPA